MLETSELESLFPSEEEGVASPHEAMINALEMENNPMINFLLDFFILFPFSNRLIVLLLKKKKNTLTP